MGYMILNNSHTYVPEDDMNKHKAALNEYAAKEHRHDLKVLIDKTNKSEHEKKEDHKTLLWKYSAQMMEIRNACMAKYEHFSSLGWTEEAKGVKADEDKVHKKNRAKACGILDMKEKVGGLDNAQNVNENEDHADCIKAKCQDVTASIKAVLVNQKAREREYSEKAQMFENQITEMESYCEQMKEYLETKEN
eukprot:Nk52_evm19s370 gene=Nk52_evmTU19s370